MPSLRRFGQLPREHADTRWRGKREDKETKRERKSKKEKNKGEEGKKAGESHRGMKKEGKQRV